MEGGAGQPVVRRWEQEEVGGKEEARWGEEQPMGVFSRDEWAALLGAGVPEAAETLAVVGC